MDNFEKDIMDHYNVKILKKEISFDGFSYIFQFSPQQQYKISNLKKYQIDNLTINAKMDLVNKMMIPLGNINGKCEILNGFIKISGSKPFIALMLNKLLENIKQ